MGEKNLLNITKSGKTELLSAKDITGLMLYR